MVLLQYVQQHASLHEPLYAQKINATLNDEETHAKCLYRSRLPCASRLTCV
jgi:hypothetical protein